MRRHKKCKSLQFTLSGLLRIAEQFNRKLLPGGKRRIFMVTLRVCSSPRNIVRSVLKAMFIRRDLGPWLMLVFWVPSQCVQWNHWCFLHTCVRLRNPAQFIVSFACTIATYLLSLKVKRLHQRQAPTGRLYEYALHHVGPNWRHGLGTGGNCCWWNKTCKVPLCAIKTPSNWISALPNQP